jgi:hypothetical protein
VIAGNDLLIVREIAVNQLRHQHNVGELEEYLVAGGGDGDDDRLFLLAADAPQFDQRPGGDDNAKGIGDGLGQRDGAHREAEPVGGGQRELRVLELCQDAGEDRAALVGGGGEGNLLNRRAQHVWLDGDASFTLWHRHDGELLRVNALDVRLTAASVQVECLRAHDQFHIHLLRRQRIDQVNECASRNGSRSLVLHLGPDPAVDADFQVGGGKFEPSGVGRQEHVAEHRQRGAG